MKIELDLEIINFSEDAILVSDGYVEKWLPKSQCRDEDGQPLDQLIRGQSGTFLVEDWLAKDNGLI